LLCTWSKDYVKYIGRNLVDASLAIRPWTDCARIGWDVIRRNPSEAFRIVFSPYSFTANRMVACVANVRVPGSAKIHVRENQHITHYHGRNAQAPCFWSLQNKSRFTATSLQTLPILPLLKTLPVLLYLTFRTLPVCPMCLFL